MSTHLKGYANLWFLASLSYHLDMFGDHGSSASRDIKYFICHVTLQKHVIEGSCNFMNGSFSQYFTTLTSFVEIGIVAVAIQCF